MLPSVEGDGSLSTDGLSLCGLMTLWVVISQLVLGCKNAEACLFMLVVKRKVLVSSIRAIHSLRASLSVFHIEDSFFWTETNKHFLALAIGSDSSHFSEIGSVSIGEDWHVHSRINVGRHDSMWHVVSGCG